MGNRFKRNRPTKTQRKEERRKRANQRIIDALERKEIIIQKKREEDRLEIIRNYGLNPDTPYNAAKEFQEDRIEYESEINLEKEEQIEYNSQINLEKEEQILKERRQKFEERFEIDSDAPDIEKYRLRWFESLDQRLDKDASKEVEVKIVKQGDYEYTLVLIEDERNFRIYERGTDEAPYELIETNKTRPIKRNKAWARNIEFLLKHSERYKEVKYVRSDGVPIDPTSDSHKICEAIFEKVKIGKEILPANPGKKGKGKNRPYHERVPREKRDIILRTWGQEYLAELCDKEPIQGELLGSGDEALAFPFGDAYIIESSDLNKATYIITKDSFPRIRHIKREELRKFSEEEGLISRILHENSNPETWKERIGLYLEGLNENGMGDKRIKNEI